RHARHLHSWSRVSNGRNGHDWSDRYPTIIGAAANLRGKSAIIDGEAIVQNGDGASDFEALQSALRRQPHTIILYAFDLLHLDGKDLRQETLLDRRAKLRTLVGDDDKSRIQFSDEFDGDDVLGHDALKASFNTGFE